MDNVKTAAQEETQLYFNLMAGAAGIRSGCSFRMALSMCSREVALIIIHSFQYHFVFHLGNPSLYSRMNPFSSSGPASGVHLFRSVVRRLASGIRRQASAFPGPRPSSVSSLDLVLDLVYFDSITTVTIHEAKTHLSRLIERALAGEEVVVTRGRDPVVALKPLKAPKIKRRLDGLPGLVTHMADDFDAPMSDFEEYSA